MSDYRAYRLDDNGHILRRYEFTCENDTEAMTEARVLAEDCDIEIWQSNRVVGRIAKNSSPRGA